MMDDEVGPLRVNCPGSRCTVFGTPSVTVHGCDDEGDRMILEVEVVPRGQPFSKKVTSSSGLVAGYKWDSVNTCAQLSASIPDLAPQQSYDFAVRVRDELGAIGRRRTDMFHMGARDIAELGDGWVTVPGFWWFDQGPCTTRQCACVPAGISCDFDAECCTGTCVNDFSHYGHCQ